MAFDHITLTLSPPSTCFGEDLSLDIFKRLPIEAICRFRSVSKCWNRVLSSPSFIELHHSFVSSSTPAELQPYLRFTLGDRCPDSSTFCNDSYALYRPQESDPEDLGEALHFPFRSRADVKGVYFTVVDVVNGVICVTYSSYSSLDSTVLWNPAIYKYVALPLLSFPSHLEKAISDFAHVDGFEAIARFESNGIGFGYDRSKNVFKVVWIWMPNSSIESVCASLPLTYEVYSSGEGEWRMATADSIKNRQFDAARRRASCFVDGTIHWLVKSYDSRRQSVVMFDCERETFRATKLPTEIHRESSTPCRVELLAYAGKLAALVELFLERHIEMWVMEEHGVASSWKILFRIPTYYELSLDSIEIYPTSLGELALYGLYQWMQFDVVFGRFQLILTCQLYDESLFLMDDTKAQSYGEEGIVLIDDNSAQV